MSGMRYEDWYCLLRNTQGDLRHYHKGIEHMIDSQEFLADSLFCEWAYIMNLDDQQFEVYRGFNKNPNARGRMLKRYSSARSGQESVAHYVQRISDNIKCIDLGTMYVIST